MANILILGVRVPFTKGGAEALVSSLATELRSREHEVDVVELPITFFPKESLLTQSAVWRSLDLTKFGDKEVDLVICTKFPTYYVNHPRKSIWLVHQHRALYDLYGTRYSDISDDPRDEQLRRMLVDGDNKVIREAKFISGISKNVVSRLKHFNGIDGVALYPPLPLGSRYSCREANDYILSVGRICNIKRVDLMLKALPIVHPFIKLKIVGVADEPGVMDYFQNEIDKHHLWDRVEFVGRASDEKLLELYANALAVYYAPYNEDYGYVTLEAFASSKPVITANDSGGVLEFVQDGVNGLVLEPNSDSIGHGVNRLVENKEWSAQLGLAGRDFIEKSGLLVGGWDSVITGLLSPMEQK
ncbi:MAG: glycosyltransferase family 4 protein [Bdellovibrionales bacterium]|nr:glycosyltransferase family 4 protein [Bdellovibrionales bacterium]